MVLPIEERHNELVIGLVGPVGSGLTQIIESLESSLNRVHYSRHLINLSLEFGEFPGIEIPGNDVSFYDRTMMLMDAGDELRKRFGADAVAVLAVAAIRKARDNRNHSGSQSDRTAYIIRSLKRPEEVRLLRHVYGSNFLLLGTHSAQDRRLTNLTRQIAESVHSFNDQDFVDQAAKLIQRDETDLSVPYGQNVRDAFPMADAFFDITTEGQINEQVQRFIDLVLGYPYHTPTQDEHSMFLAHATRLRSAALGRQVGAAIASNDGEILSVGTNEVPKAGGGQYWPDTPNEQRDYLLKMDSNDQMKQDVLVDLLERLKNAGWLSEKFSSMGASEWISTAMAEPAKVWQGSHIASLIEYGRIVHAEMAAITTAARLGLSLRDSVLYATTFPCHDCAKHIVAAGISRVVYVDPYPKSLVGRMFADSIIIDPNASIKGKVAFQPFTGVAPRAYHDLFEAPIRKDALGKTIEWDSENSTPRNQEVFEYVWRNEADVGVRFQRFHQGKLDM